MEEGNSFIKYCSDLKDNLFSISIDIRELATLAVYICYVLYPKKPKDFVWDICGDYIVQKLLNDNNNTINYPVLNKNGNIEWEGNNYLLIERKIDDNDRNNN